MNRTACHLSAGERPPRAGWSARRQRHLLAQQTSVGGRSAIGCAFGRRTSSVWGYRSVWFFSLSQGEQQGPYGAARRLPRSDRRRLATEPERASPGPAGRVLPRCAGRRRGTLRVELGQFCLQLADEGADGAPEVREREIQAEIEGAGEGRAVMDGCRLLAV